MTLLVDLLTDEELHAIDRVLVSKETRFDFLVKISGLDPKQDFKYADLRRLDFSDADLRGFDFTGADLRECVRNEKTNIDETTILKEAKVKWLERDALDIIMRLQQIENAKNSGQRNDLLQEIMRDIGPTKHVVEYLISAAERASTIEVFLDYASYIPKQIAGGKIDNLRETSLRLLDQKYKRIQSRTGRSQTKSFAVQPIVEKMDRSPGSFLELAFDHLAKLVDTEQMAVSGGFAEITPEHLRKAFSHIGG